MGPNNSTTTIPPEEHACELTDEFAIYVQLLLAFLAFSSLLIKRAREHPPRPLQIWFFDTSKQAVAAAMIHASNVLVSSFFSLEPHPESGTSQSPCVWYFLNIGVDTTLGVGILWGFLSLYYYFLNNLGVTDIRTGFYGHPPRFMAWLKQLSIFAFAELSMKITVVILFKVFPFIYDIGAFLLSPLEKTPDRRAEVVVVMLIFPLIMNVIQAWLVDSIIRDQFKAERYERIDFTEESLDEILPSQELMLPPLRRSSSSWSDELENGNRGMDRMRVRPRGDINIDISRLHNTSSPGIE